LTCCGGTGLPQDVKKEKGQNAMQDEKILQDLQSFAENTAEFMARLPAKEVEQEGNEGGVPLFSPTALEQQDYVLARDTLRHQATDLDKIVAGRAAFAANDQADRLVDTYRYTGLKGMEDQGLMEARLSSSPWSDDYWAIYLGQLGKRYADPGFPNATDWQSNYNYTQNNTVQQIVASGNTEAIKRLSPSEKYDILVGDPQYSLTKKMWEEGKNHYLRNNGHVETWMGLCHGWAAASYMLPRPTKAVTVTAANGVSLTFYPSDIKALATLLWSKIRVPLRFIGGRCNERNPATDPQTGRILPQNCFDTNPGTWHLSVVNQIGVSQRSMIMDATYDYEVWNQPIVGYRYSYFNPSTQAPALSLTEARVYRSAFHNDKFARFRSPNTDSMVGISMEVSYVVETSPSHHSPDSPQRDKITRVRYVYDLELDFSEKIIGGEWYQNAHPDFLWTPGPGVRALPAWEARRPLTEIWERNQPIPSMWQQVAAITSEYNQVALAAIVDRLITFSNQ
jgi:hypothetical protein